MPTSTASFTMDSATFAQLLTAAVRRNGTVRGGASITIPVPTWTPTIPDPAWTPTVDDGKGNQIPNPIQPQPQIVNPVTPQQFTENLIISLGTKILQDDLSTQADLAKIVAMAAHNAAEELIRNAAIAAANAALNPNVTVTVQ